MHFYKFILIGILLQIIGKTNNIIDFLIKILIRKSYTHLYINIEMNNFLIFIISRNRRPIQNKITTPYEKSILTKKKPFHPIN